MVSIIVETPPEQLSAVLALLENSGLELRIIMEDEADKNLRPMTSIDFYKRINAANKAEIDGELVNHPTVVQEVASW
ncbi:hypothetical protein [Eisenibacter elegans]|jgi:hypothetical protein|uniref:hypothetical protein n=1 Tax=Eisenibacter elegans TaxID=997 RepID=UPI0004028180|nr:hypothetical protein [Eisenibacter elegans]